jgi:hypothetical protein
MPQEEALILELEDQLRPRLKEFLIRMFERGFAASVEAKSKNLGIASGMTRSGVRQELKLIDAWLSEATNESIPSSSLAQRLANGRQLDVAEDVYLMGHQLAVQRLHKNGRCPIARMEGNWIPVLTFEFGSDVWRRSDPFVDVKLVGAQEDERHGAGRLDASDALASEIPHLMERPFAHFLAARLLESSSPAQEASAPNVEVRNIENGWEVIYSPAYLSRRNQLGGPSTPVKGYLAAGTYRFGIAKPGEVIWDETRWNVPTSSPIFIPIP